MLIENVNHYVDDTDGIAVPATVYVLLKNVKLCREVDSVPVTYTGEFWYRRLTDYGKDLMRALVKAAGTGFSYAENYLEDEEDHSAALLLLQNLSHTVHMLLMENEPECVLAGPYLQEKQVALNPHRLEEELAHIVHKVRCGYYEENGHLNVQHLSQR